MTRQIYDDLDLLSELWKKHPYYFNDWEKKFAKSTVERFKLYGIRTNITDGQAESLKNTVKNVKRKSDKDFFG